MNIITNFFNQLFGSSSADDKQSQIIADLMRRESEIGRQLFGPIPPGVRREFFCMDEHTWIWHEESKGKTRVTKYQVKPNEVLKSVNGSQYEKVSKQEALHLLEAAEIYTQRVKSELYNT